MKSGKNNKMIKKKIQNMNNEDQRQQLHLQIKQGYLLQKAIEIWPHNQHWGGGVRFEGLETKAIS